MTTTAWFIRLKPVGSRLAASYLERWRGDAERSAPHGGDPTAWPWLSWTDLQQRAIRWTRVEDAWRHLDRRGLAGHAEVVEEVVSC